MKNVRFQNNLIRTAAVMLAAAMLILAGCGAQSSGTGPSTNENTNTPSAPARQRLTFFSGPTGGSWFPISAALGSIWSSEVSDKIEGVEVHPGGGLLNVKAVANGQAQVALGQGGPLADARAGVEPFEDGQDYTMLAGIYADHPMAWTPVILKDSASSWDDVKANAKKIVLGPSPQGHYGELLTRRILEEMGMKYEDFSGVQYLDYADTVDNMRDGHIHFFGPAAVVPTSAVMDISTSREVTFLSLPEDVIDSVCSKYGGLSPVTLPAGTYPNQKEDVRTVGFSAVVFTSGSLPEDMVYDMTKAVFDRKADIVAAHSASAHASVENWKECGIPLHPGAAKYYKEQGQEIPDEWIWKP